MRACVCLINHHSSLPWQYDYYPHFLYRPGDSVAAADLCCCCWSAALYAILGYLAVYGTGALLPSADVQIPSPSPPHPQLAPGGGGVESPDRRPGDDRKGPTQSLVAAPVVMAPMTRSGGGGQTTNVAVAAAFVDTERCTPATVDDVDTQEEDVEEKDTPS